MLPGTQRAQVQRTLHGCVWVPAKWGTRPHHCSRLLHPSDIPALLSSSVSHVLSLLVYSFHHTRVLGCLRPKCQGWLYLLTDCASPSLRQQAGCPLGHFRHPLQACPLLFWHMLLFPEYLSLCSSVSSEALGPELWFFIHVSPGSSTGLAFSKCLGSAD